MIGGAEEIQVPFLVTKVKLEQPIIGFNVIELIIKTTDLQSDDLCDVIGKCLGNPESSQALIQLVTAVEGASELCCIKSRKQATHIPANQTITVSCVQKQDQSTRRHQSSSNPTPQHTYPRHCFFLDTTVPKPETLRTDSEETLHVFIHTFPRGVFRD